MMGREGRGGDIKGVKEGERERGDNNGDRRKRKHNSRSILTKIW